MAQMLLGPTTQVTIESIASALYARIIAAGLSPDIDTWVLVSDEKLKSLIGPMAWLVYQGDRVRLKNAMRKVQRGASTDSASCSPYPT